MNGFSAKLDDHGLALTRGAATVLQINVGKLCNQTCVHCHVGAGPRREEIMTAETADRIIAWIMEHRPRTVDITGGAPELCPEFRRLLTASREAGAHVMVRCNLTVIHEPGQGDLPEFYASHGIEVVASLPCYLQENVDKQRGAGAYEGSIAALRLLNAQGYGTRLPLTLVYNPVGASLPPPQPGLEAAYRDELRKRFDIEFTRLICITNVPITRFESYLKATGQYHDYSALLYRSFNPDTVSALMCRDTINVGWEGELYDCDFNQMLDLPMGRRPATLICGTSSPADMDGESVIRTGSHCFGCTAGAGSSCGGVLA